MWWMLYDTMDRRMFAVSSSFSPFSPVESSDDDNVVPAREPLLYYDGHTGRRLVVIRESPSRTYPRRWPRSAITTIQVVGYAQWSQFGMCGRSWSLWGADCTKQMVWRLLRDCPHPQQSRQKEGRKKHPRGWYARIKREVRQYFDGGIVRFHVPPRYL